MEKKRSMTRRGAHAAERRRLLPIVALVTAAALLAFAGIAVARYLLQQEQDGLATATDFYFTSDYLKESSEGATYFIDPQTESFEIVLSNSADAQRTTKENISYKVSATDAAVISESGTLAGGSPSTTKLTVKPQDKDTFTVTAESTSPYAKKLTATFTLAKGNHYTVEDAPNNTAAVLTITCADSGGPVTIELPAGVVPDTTDGRVSKAGSAWTFAPSGSGVYSLVLLKSNTSLNLAGGDNFGDKITLSAPSAS